MLYHEFGHAAAWPGRAAAEMWRLFLNPLNPFAHTPMARGARAGCELFERATRRYAKPEFGISATKVNGRTVPIAEETVWQSPFCRLLHFKRDGRHTSTPLPRLLLVAPMSGHYATLLRGTVEALLPNVPFSAGQFDLDDYIDTVADIFRYFEGDVHVFAVCQP